MIFRGQKFRRTKKVVDLPFTHNSGEHKNYVSFGRVCSKNTPNAVRTEYRWDLCPFGDVFEETDEGNIFPVYAVQIPDDGYSLTNLMYGKDGYMYLLYEGKVYIRKRKKLDKSGKIS